MSDLEGYCKDCGGHRDLHIRLCPKHAAVDRLIEALADVMDIADEEAFLRARALLDEIKKASSHV